MRVARLGSVTGCFRPVGRFINDTEKENPGFVDSRPCKGWFAAVSFVSLWLVGCVISEPGGQKADLNKTCLHPWLAEWSVRHRRSATFSSQSPQKYVFSTEGGIAKTDSLFGRLWLARSASALFRMGSKKRIGDRPTDRHDTARHPSFLL